MAEQGRLRRSMSFQAIRAVNMMLEVSGRAMINYQLQIAACTVAAEDVLAPLNDFVEQKLAELMATHRA